jgi:hypothetical protein
MTEKKGVKIVTIGGGSSYTPELMQGFIKRYKVLPIREIWLVDIEDGKEKLEIVGALAQRMWDASGYPVKVHLTLDRREALKDADFVTTQFRVGLLYARIKDERIPLSHGMIGQETNGAGGDVQAAAYSTCDQGNCRRYERALSERMVDQLYQPLRHDHRNNHQAVWLEEMYRLMQCAGQHHAAGTGDDWKEGRRSELPVCRLESLPLS